MIRRKMFIHLVVFSFAAQSFGAEVWVTTPQISSEEALEKIARVPRDELKNVEVKSALVLLNHPVPNEILRSFLELEAEANQASLQGEFNKAKELFNTLLKRLETIPNVAGVEHITLTAKIRIAELASALKFPNAKKLWADAHAWDPNFDLPRDEFSPSVIRSFRSTKVNTRTLFIKAPEYARVFVDGKPVNRHDESYVKEAEPGPHQVAILAPGSKWFLQNALVSESGRLEPVIANLEPLVVGQCDSPKYIGDPLPKTVRLLVSFNDGACERILDGDKWLSLQGRSLEPVSQAMAINTSSPSETKGPGVLKSPWFWSGVAAAVVAVVIISSQKEQTQVVPVHSDR